nr:AAA family ATPase [uncultured Flavobacterium sp.]
MDKEKIKEWFLINGVKEKTISDYISCLGTVNKILKDNNIEGLEGWNIENWNYLFGNLEKIEKYKEREISGNKILSNALSNYLKFLKNQDFFIKLRNEKSLIEISTKVDVQNTIYFGSPGTGKSHKADEITYGKDVQKVTFHPDYDYHSFVGGYKPTMDGDKIAYKFVPQIFTKIYVDAWKNLVLDEETKPFYLQIEEINRGNCAEIFGDLFQLLDRDKDGFSKYEVTAEEELCKYLLSEKGFGGNHPGIANGKLRFPNNLKIIATMNTSDQSLFPMDSAFKRRWDWIYVPIDTDCKYSDFTIQLDNGKAFEWLSFLKVINEEIFEITKSQDKQIGNWFIDAQNSGKVITESTFVNKVIFYLWNDVFKDEENTIFKAADGKNLTYTSFFENGTSNNLVSYILEERLKLIDVNKAEPTTTEEE